MPATTVEADILIAYLACELGEITLDRLREAVSVRGAASSAGLGEWLRDNGYLKPDVYEQLLEKRSAVATNVDGLDHQKLLEVRAALSAAPIQAAASPPVGESAAVGLAATLPFSGPQCQIPPTREDSPPGLGVAASRTGVAAHQVMTSYGELQPHAQGGLGVVCRARDLNVNREVALKQMRADRFNETGRADFVRESHITVRLEHPGVVPVYGVGADNEGRPFYVMRFIKGKTLQEAADTFHQFQAGARTRNVELRRLLGHFITVCNTVDYAHSRGVVHRDLKPSNIMLGDFGETLVVDWGLAILSGNSIDENVSRPQDPLSLRETIAALPVRDGTNGTPAYMSPEQVDGNAQNIRPCSDIYSLGAILYTILTGKALYTGKTALEIFGQVVTGHYLPPRQVDRSIPRGLEAICRRALALQPEDRYRSARALADDIGRWMADEPVAAFSESPWHRASRWLRRHQVLATSTGFFLIAAVLGLALSTLFITEERSKALTALDQEKHARRERARAQLLQLETADPLAAAEVIKGLKPYRDDMLQELQTAWNRDSSLSERRMRAGLVLLASDPSVKEPLLQWLLKIDDPRVLYYAVDLLASHFTAKFKADLWNRAADEKLPGRDRLHTLVMLADSDASNPEWKRHAREAVTLIFHENTLFLGLYREAFKPAQRHLREPLMEEYRNPRQPDSRLKAATLLVSYAGEDEPVLLELLARADGPAFEVLLPRLLGRKAKLLPKLREVLREPAEAEGSDKLRAEQAVRKANAAAALLRLDEPKFVWELLQEQRGNPTLRTHLIHSLSSRRVPAGTVADRYSWEADKPARRALLLALGSYQLDELEEEKRAILSQRLLKEYEEEPDPGIHAAVHWLMRKWKLDSRAADARLKGAGPKGRRWFVSPEGQTFNVLGPDQFHLGAGDESGGRRDETKPNVRIPRSFALGGTEVTVGQFQHFCKEKKLDHESMKIKDSEAEAASLVSWYEAAQFCRWLSEKEGIPEGQMCFPPHDEIEKCKDGKAALKLAENYLSLTGYRLPTSAEWEYACRAGTLTARFSGQSSSLFGEYAWWGGNLLRPDQGRPTQVGLLKPNDFGFFDIYGNALEWCLTPEASGMTNPNLLAEDVEIKDFRVGEQALVARGGSFMVPLPYANSNRKLYFKASYKGTSIGFRVARTIPES